MERETYDYKPPGRDLNYKLSRSPLAGADMALSETERIEAMIANFQSQNVAISNRSSTEKDGVMIHAFRFTMPGGEATSLIRVAFVGNQIYRVLATAGKNESEPPELEQFLGSFQVRAQR